MTDTSFKEGRGSCTFIMRGEGTSRKGKVEIIEIVIDGTKFLKGPSLPGKGLETQIEGLTLERRRDISFIKEGGGEERYMQMQVSLKGVVWMAWVSLWEKRRV